MSNDNNTMAYSFNPKNGGWPIKLTHEILANRTQHRLVYGDVAGPWVLMGQLAMMQVQGRNFVAQLAIQELPYCFEFLPANEFQKDKANG